MDLNSPWNFIFYRQYPLDNSCIVFDMYCLTKFVLLFYLVYFLIPAP